MYLNKSHHSFFSVVCGGTLLGLLFFLWGCVSDEYPPGNDTRMGVLRFALSTDIPHDVSTRSVNENAINDLHLLVYDASHKLLKKVYYSSPIASPADLTLLIRIGSGYTVYGIANTGNSSLFGDVSAVDTESKLKAFTTALSSWDGIGNGSYLLMSGIATNVSVLASSTNPSSPSSTCSLPLKRLAAKVTLDVSVASGSGIIISGYRIYGLPLKSYYISNPLTTEENTDGIDTQTTRAVDASLPANGADWINSGLVSLSNVTSFNTSFYMYENRPGVNTAITSQKNKIKANVPATPADSAAYVMIYGKGGGYSSLSWKVYLGANNSSNFNVKRNCKYTFTITLKANTSDTRITYNPKLIWAGSNIYWDGTKLTFDPPPSDPANPTVQELANMQKQGLAFQWGSLIGISLSSNYVTYTPTYNSTIPANSTWSQGAATWGSFYITDDASGYGQTSTYLNDAARNTDANYAALKGDICKYLSKVGAVSGNWRMPTQSEFNAAGLADGSNVSWTTTTSPWALYGSFAIESGNDQGTTQFSSGGKYTVNGITTVFPVGYYREATAVVRNNGAGYWSSSVASTTNAYNIFFGSNFCRPANSYGRGAAATIRCVQN